MNILCFTPTYGDGPRPETLASVAGQDFSGEMSHEVSWHNPYPGGDSRNVLAQYLRGRELALDGGYDALLTVEHDMQLPPYALRLLWDTGADVVYGVYLFRHGGAILNAWEYLGPGSHNIGESLSLHRSKLDKAIKRQVVQVSGVGFGCTLIRRDVLERIPFRSGQKGTEAPDIPFATDVLRAGLTQVAHFGVLCGHWTGQNWIVPLGSAEMTETTRVRANRNVTVRVGGGTKELIAGQEYDLPSYEVHDLARAGYITPLPQRAEQTIPLPQPMAQATKPAPQRAVRPRKKE